METLENVRQVALRYARAGITDDELYAVRARLQYAHRDVALESELESVG